MAEFLEKLNIRKIKDLIEYYPRSYEDRTKIYQITELKTGENCLFMGTVCDRIQIRRIRKNLAIYSTFVSDATGVCKLVFYNQKYIANTLKEGNLYLFFGKPSFQQGRLCVESPEIYPVSEIEKIKGIYPIYPLTAGITQNYLFKLVHKALENEPFFEETFLPEFRKEHSLCEINYAVHNVHFPKSFHDMYLARNRIIFDELFYFQLAMMLIKNSNVGKKKANRFQQVELEPFLSLLPFSLTNAQMKVIHEIEKDMYSNKLMNRLVQGDVGSGKTMVAAIAMYIAVKNGYQSAMMAPTTILANQHFEELDGYFSKLGIRCAIITSSTTKKKKEKIVEQLRSHEIDIVIGTHSLIEDNIEFDKLGLVITDEQHRFGVKQRMKLSAKGNEIETLVMTATPIPRTLSIMLYGDLDLSIIDEMPPGRSPVKTYAINESLETRVNEFIKKQIREGRQIYVVCPLVEENDTLDLNSVEKLYDRYKNEIFSEFEVEFLHGKMKNKEKDEIMKRFKENKTHILISTTVIEVGISVSNATVMVIENADRFGLAALHQLRGRVGRGAHQSYCILKSKNHSLKSRERLKIMEQSNSGFDIAQKDLELRGPGDFFGVRQSGLPEFKLANLLTDVTLLKEAQEAAKELILNDPNLKNPMNQKIKEMLYQKFGEQLTNRNT